MPSPRVLLATLAASLLLAPAAGAEPQRIVLRDGSVLVAEIVALEKGVYTLKSPELGRVRVPQERVRAIQPASPTPPARSAGGRSSAPETTGAGVQDVQLRVLSDPRMTQEVLKLQSSPAMQEVLQDPEILRLVARRDLEALKRHPKMQKLMEDPAVRSLAGDLAPPSAKPAATSGARPGAKPDPTPPSPTP